MNKHVGKRPRTFWVAIALFVSGFGFLGYGGWQYFFSDAVDGAGKQSEALSYTPSSVDAPTKPFVDPAKATQLGDVFARLVAPRLETDYVRLVGEGTKWHPVLNEIGIGHYTGTALPGEVGNFATAAHRGGFGGSYRNIHRFVEGDKVYVQTNEAWYTYRYLQTKIVKPDEIDVISPAPKSLIGSKEGGRYMTMTSCDPIYVNSNRIIVWFELEKIDLAGSPAPAAVKWLETK
jgi:sortase A